jgi:hypothetical protein
MDVLHAQYAFMDISKIKFFADVLCRFLVEDVGD